MRPVLLPVVEIDGNDDNDDDCDGGKVRGAVVVAVALSLEETDEADETTENGLLGDDECHKRRFASSRGGSGGKLAGSFFLGRDVFK